MLYITARSANEQGKAVGVRQKPLTHTCEKIADQLDALVVPAGPAWVAANRVDSELSFYKSDNLHPSHLGAYLTACVFYSTLFEETPSGADDGSYRDKNLEANREKLEVPKGKQLLMNRLIKIDSQLYNCCELLPLGSRQCKLFPDQPELEAGINPGCEQKVFELNDKRFKVIICTDLRYISEITTNDLDFVFFIFHFSDYNFADAMQSAKDLSLERELPVIISSLVSDKNIGFSSYINKDTVVSLSDSEGILEIEGM